ncbi:MAG: hypothetical protein IKQ71_02355 [Lachnospiraceae bacterium]|nr:hypothetical protein [Lachnospiraceae bacterium]
MNICRRCKITINDDAMMCPLCHGILEDTDIEADEELDDPETYDSRSITYPDVTPVSRTLHFIMKLLIFASVVAGFTTVVINAVLFNGFWWSLIVCMSLAYGCFVVLYVFRTRKSLQKLIQVQMVVGILFLIALDFALGYSAWSVKYAIPIILVATDVSVAVIMLVGDDNWQSYVMTEIVTFLFSVVMIVLGVFVKVNILDVSIFSIGAVVITGLLLATTIVFGDRIIQNELRRRFHI